MASKIKKGDTVVVIAGRDKGKKGEVLKVLPKDERVLVKGVNVVKKHKKQTQTQAGGIISEEATIHISNVAYLDPKKDVATRIGFAQGADGKKVRVAKKSSTEL